MRWLRDAWWWFRHRLDPRHQYHVVRTGLPPGYYDPSVRIMWAFFSQVETFVEGTRDTVAWDAEDGHKEAWTKLHAAYLFWQEHKPVDDLEFDAWTTVGRELQEMADKHMHNVISVLGYMWFP